MLFQLSFLAAISERWSAITIFHCAAPNIAYSGKSDLSLLDVYAKISLTEVLLIINV